MLKKKESRDLTTADIKKLVGTKADILLYENLAGIRSLDELFQHNDTIILLYETSRAVGHWVTLIYDQKNHKLSVFDSYGFGKLDSELKYATYNHTPYLTELVNKERTSSGLQLDVSDKKLQKRFSDVNTCGRWAAMRAIFKKISNEQFENIFLNSDTGLSPDDLVTRTTMAMGV